MTQNGKIKKIKKSILVEDEMVRDHPNLNSIGGVVTMPVFNIPHSFHNLVYNPLRLYFSIVKSSYCFLKTVLHHFELILQKLCLEWQQYEFYYGIAAEAKPNV